MGGRQAITPGSFPMPHYVPSNCVVPTMSKKRRLNGFTLPATHYIYIYMLGKCARGDVETVRCVFSSASVKQPHRSHPRTISPLPVQNDIISVKFICLDYTRRGALYTLFNATHCAPHGQLKAMLWLVVPTATAQRRLWLHDDRVRNRP